MKILWLSRHVPQEAQIAALQKRFNKIEIIERWLKRQKNAPRFCPICQEAKS